MPSKLHICVHGSLEDDEPAARLLRIIRKNAGRRTIVMARNATRPNTPTSTPGTSTNTILRGLHVSHSGPQHSGSSRYVRGGTPDLASVALCRRPSTADGARNGARVVLYTGGGLEPVAATAPDAAAADEASGVAAVGAVAGRPVTLLTCSDTAAFAFVATSFPLRNTFPIMPTDGKLGQQQEHCAVIDAWSNSSAHCMNSKARSGRLGQVCR